MKNIEQFSDQNQESLLKLKQSLESFQTEYLEDAIKSYRWVRDISIANNVSEEEFIKFIQEYIEKDKEEGLKEVA